MAGTFSIQSTTAKSPRLHFPQDTSHVVPSGQQCFPSVQQTACKTIKLINHGSTLSIIDEFKVKSQTMTILICQGFYVYMCSWFLSEQINFQWDDDDEVCFVLDQHASLDFYSASSLKQQSTDKHVVQLGQNILLLSQPVFTYSLVLCAQQRINKYQLHSLWFDPIGAWTHELSK